MSLHPDDAAAALDDIAAIERRTRESLFYAGSGNILIAWGVLCVIGYVFNWLHPRNAVTAWLALDAVGVVATCVILARRIPRSRLRVAGLQQLATYLAFMVFGVLVHIEFAPVRARQAEVFWPTLVMFGYVLMGIWAGRFLAYLGVLVTILILVGFFELGPWFLPWMAVVFGGGLIAAGLWLRRTL